MSSTNNNERTDNNNQENQDEINFADLVSNILLTTEDQENINSENDYNEGEDEYNEGENDYNEGENVYNEGEAEYSNSGAANDDHDHDDDNMMHSDDAIAQVSDKEDGNDPLHDNINHILKNNHIKNLNRRDSVLGEGPNQEWLKLLQNDIRRGSFSAANSGVVSQRRQSIAGNDADDAFLTSAILQSLKSMSNEAGDENQQAVEDDQDNDRGSGEAEIENMQLVDDVLKDILMQGVNEVQPQVPAEKPAKQKKESKKKKKAVSQDDDLQALINQVVSNTLQEHAQLGTKHKQKGAAAQLKDAQIQTEASKKKKGSSLSLKKRNKKVDDLDIAKIMKDAMSMAKTKQTGVEPEHLEEGEPVEQEDHDRFSFDDLDLNLEQIIENTMQPIILQEEASRHQLLQQQQLQVQRRLQAIAKQKALEKKQQKEEARAARKKRKEEKQHKLEEEKKLKKLAKLNKKTEKEEAIKQEKARRIEKRKQKNEMKDQQKILKSIEKENKRKIKEADKLAKQLRRDHKRKLREKKEAAQQLAAASGLKPTSFISQKLKTDDKGSDVIPAYKARLAQIRTKGPSLTGSNGADEGSSSLLKQKPLSTAALLQKYNIPPIPTVDALGNPLSSKEIKKAEQKALRRLENERAKERQRLEKQRARELRRLQKEELKRFRQEEKKRRLAYFKQMRKEQELKMGVSSSDLKDEIVPGVNEDVVRRAISLNLKPNKSLTSKKRKLNEHGSEHQSKKQKRSKEQKEAKKKAKLEKEERRRLKREQKKTFLPGANVMELEINPASEPSLAKAASETQASQLGGTAKGKETSINSSLVTIIKPEVVEDGESSSDSDSDLEDESGETEKKRSGEKKYRKKETFYVPPDLSILASSSVTFSKNSLRLIPVVLKGPPFPWYLRVDSLGIPKLPLAKNNTKNSLLRKKKYEEKHEIDLNGRDLVVWQKFKQKNPNDYNEKYNMYIKEIQKALLKKFGRKLTIDLDIGIIENGEIFELDNEKAHPPFVIPEIPVFSFGEHIIKSVKYGNVSKNWLQTIENENEIAKIMGNNISLIKNLKLTWFNRELHHQNKIRNELLKKERAKEQEMKNESERFKNGFQTIKKTSSAATSASPQTGVMIISKPTDSASKFEKELSKNMQLLLNTPPLVPLNSSPPAPFAEIEPPLKTHLERELNKIRPIYKKMDSEAMTAFLPIVKCYYTFQLQWVSKFQSIQSIRKYIGKIAKNFHKQFEVEKQVLNFKNKFKHESLEFFNEIANFVSAAVDAFLVEISNDKKMSEEGSQQEEEINLKRVNKAYLEQIFIIAMSDAIESSAKMPDQGFLSTVKLDSTDIDKKKRKFDYNINGIKDHEIQKIQSSAVLNVNSTSTFGKQNNHILQSKPLKIEEGNDKKPLNQTVAKIEEPIKQLDYNDNLSYGAKKSLQVKEMFFKQQFDIPPRKTLTRMKVMMKRIQTKVSSELFKKFELEYKNERMRRYRAFKGTSNKHHVYSQSNGKISDNELLNLLVYIQGGSTALAEEILSDMRADTVLEKKPAKKRGKYKQQVETDTEIKEESNEHSGENVISSEVVDLEKDARRSTLNEVDLLNEPQPEPLNGQKRHLEIEENVEKHVDKEDKQEQESAANLNKKQKTSSVEVEFAAENRPEEVEKEKAEDLLLDTEVDPSLANM